MLGQYNMYTGILCEKVAWLFVAEAKARICGAMNGSVREGRRRRSPNV